MPGTANGDPKSDLMEDGSLAGFETLEALLEVQTFDNPALEDPLLVSVLSFFPVFCIVLTECY